MVMLECKVLFFSITVCIEDRLPAIASLVYYCAVLTRMWGEEAGTIYQGAGPIYDAYVFVFLNSIIIC